MSLTPKNWSDFQHYKDRSPAWIKLHRGLLDDYDFARLPVASRALAPLLWLLASEYENGRITASIDEIAFRLRWPEKELNDALRPLIDKEFFIAASGALADGKRDACLEEERETEEEKKETISRSVAPATRPIRPSDFDEFWKAYPRRDGSNPKAPAEKAFRAAVKAGADSLAIIAGAKRCAERDRDKIGTPYIPQAVKWLRDKRWQDYNDEPTPQASSDLIHVMQDSPEWPAWAAQWRQKRGRDPPVDRLGGWNFPAEWQSERLQAAE